MKNSAGIDFIEVDSFKKEMLVKLKASGDDSVLRIAVTYYVVGIVAKLVPVSSDEQIERFCKLFVIPHDMTDNVKDMFAQAIEDNADMDHYVRQLVNFYPDDVMFRKAICQSVFQFVCGDGVPENAILFELKRLVLLLGLGVSYFGDLLRKHYLQGCDSLYSALGVTSAYDYVEIKERYREVVKQCHPDVMASKDVPDEMREVAYEKFQFLSDAFQQMQIKTGYARKVA